jgi:hypothetical protein
MKDDVFAMFQHHMTLADKATCDKSLSIVVDLLENFACKNMNSGDTLVVDSSTCDENSIDFPQAKLISTSPVDEHNKEEHQEAGMFSHPVLICFIIFGIYQLQPRCNPVDLFLSKLHPSCKWCMVAIWLQLVALQPGCKPGGVAIWLQLVDEPVANRLQLVLLHFNILF